MTDVVFITTNLIDYILFVVALFSLIINFSAMKP